MTMEAQVKVASPTVKYPLEKQDLNLDTLMILLARSQACTANKNHHSEMKWKLGCEK